MVKAVYPGSFDPVTMGHRDIATRAAGLFEKVIIAIYHSPESKSLMFSTEERVEMFRDAVKEVKNIEVVSYTGLTTEFTMKVGAKAIVRGLRIGSDFEYEFQMAMMNKSLEPKLEVVCLMTSVEYQFVSSSLLKEVARLGGDISSMVPPMTGEALRRKVGAKGSTAQPGERRAPSKS